MKKSNLDTSKGATAMSLRYRILLTISVVIFGLLATPTQAQQTSSRVTVDANNETFENVLNSIQKQTGMSFVYNASDLDVTKKVTLVAKGESLVSVLDKLFSDRGISYTIKDNYIVLSKKTDQQSSNKGASKGVSGIIKSDKGIPLVGATLMIKGTQTGTVADIDGRFTLPTAKVGDILEASLIGHKKQSIPVTSNAPLTIVLVEDNELLDAVVVTALGIKREQKALTYNAQEIAGDAVNTVKDANFVNALSGKVAGLQINANASGAGGSTRVVMRGLKSLNGNNNALYVIDGIPMSNFRTKDTAGTYENGDDAGDFEGISNFNPEDIESMTTLSGATAAALYGSQGANGVILITTKKGKAGELKVNYSNSTTFSSPFVMPRFQNRYGTNENEPLMSWGDKLTTPTNYDPKDFFQTGFNETNSVGLSFGTERNQTYASASAVNARGIVPNNAYNRYNFTVRNTSVLVPEKLTLNLGASYMKQYGRNDLIQGEFRNPLIGIYLFPRGDDIRKYQIYERPGSENYMEQFWGLNFFESTENPWWIVNRELFEKRVHRYSFDATLKYDVTEYPLSDVHIAA